MLFRPLKRLDRISVFSISFLCAIFLFVVLDPSVYPHFQNQILGKDEPLHSIDVVFEQRFQQLFPAYTSNSNNNSRLHRGHILRHRIFQKDEAKKFGPKRNSSSYNVFDNEQKTELNILSSLQLSPYILPSQISQEGNIPKNRFTQQIRTATRRQIKFIAFYNKPEWLDTHIAFDRCQVSDCRMVGTLAQDKAHAVVFSIPDLRQQTPPPRPRGQRWVYYNLESPANTNNITSSFLWRHQFNLTMTYRTDSDVFLPYAYFQEKNSQKGKDYESIARGKSKMAAIFVSNCLSASGRLEYVQRIQEFVPVDVYGKCGPYKCYSKRHEDCLDILHEKYKFYLSFENSLCTDYVTEKFTKTFRNIDVIPVVRGGGNYSMILPRDTYINADWFSSSKDLGLYLQRIGKDVRRYAELLRQKDRFVEVDPLPIQRAFCDLCLRLHEDQDENGYYYTDVSKWFGQGACQQHKHESR